MSKRVLVLLVAALMAVSIFGAVAKAGVDGSFKFDIWMWPEGVLTGIQTETAKFDIDFEALLKLNITLSGLTISQDVAMGVAGVEHYIVDLKTTLGALNLYDEFAFARPYIDCPSYSPGALKEVSLWPSFPVPFTSCHRVGELLFAKKRVQLDITIGGLTAFTKIAFEDVNFPDPAAHTIVDTMHPDETGACVAGADGQYDYCDQLYRFGAIVGFSGTTISGIDVTAETGLCADFTIFPAFYYVEPAAKWYDLKIIEYVRNRIKKKSWTDYTVSCTGTSSDLAFTKELISVTNLSPVPGLVFNNYLVFRPILNLAFRDYTELVYTLPMNLGTVWAWLDFYSPKYMELEPEIDPYHYYGPLGNPIVNLILGNNFMLVWEDVNRTLSMDAGDLMYAFLTMNVQNTTITNIVEDTVGLGLSRMLNEIDIPISYPEPIGELLITNVWVPVEEGGTIKWEYVDFDLTKNFGEHNSFHIDTMFNEDGLLGVDLTIGVSFSL